MRILETIYEVVYDITQQSPEEMMDKLNDHLLALPLMAAAGAAVGIAYKMNAVATLCFAGGLALGCGGALLAAWGLQLAASKKLIDWQWALWGSGALMIALPVLLAVGGVASGILPVTAGYLLGGAGICFSAVPIGLAFILSSTKIFSQIARNNNNV